MKANTNKSTSINTSIITKLKDQGSLTDKTLVGIGSLSLEDLIAVKLELSCNNINNRLFGFDIWRQTGYIVKEALLKFAISTTNSKKSAARFLGLTYDEFKKSCTRYSIDI
jgi:hypothetical protein|tara:strand:- start:425 stop:757 length:333 start_codon:yes stop_codon:yes gene_type:complete